VRYSSGLVGLDEMTHGGWLRSAIMRRIESDDTDDQDAGIRAPDAPVSPDDRERRAARRENQGRRLTRICVFCGSSSGNRAVYATAARQLAAELVSRRIGLVFGGGCVGLMGVVADAVLAAGGHVIGVIPHALLARELAHRGVQDLRVVASMHERKALMADLSDGFIAMPGGFGTFEELCEVITWTQLGLHRKRCGLLNVDGFFDPLLQLFTHASAEGFVRPSNLVLVCAYSDPRTLVGEVLEPLAEPEPKWLGPTET
jgi:uncharacterized protein (TIGR00730 family)